MCISLLLGLPLSTIYGLDEYFSCLHSIILSKKTFLLTHISTFIFFTHVQYLNWESESHYFGGVNVQLL